MLYSLLLFGVEMPVIFRCGKCNTIIYKFERVGQDCFGLPTPSELLVMFNSKCPSCGKRLKLPDIDDIVIVGRLKDATVDHRYQEVNIVNEGNHPLRSIAIHGGTLRIASINQ